MAEGDAPGAFTVYDTTGRRLDGSGPATADAATRQALLGRPASGHHDGVLVVATAITDRSTESVVGAVRVTQDDDVVAGQARRAWLAMSAVILAALLVAAAVARAEARRLAAPIARLAEQAARFGEGAVAASTPPSGLAEVDLVAETMERSSLQLIEALARERAFSADVSHQLRTPLTGLRLRLERAVDSPDPAGAVAGALIELKRLEATVEHLLALARDSQPTSGVLDVEGVVTAAGERWATRFDECDRRLVVEAADALTPVRASEVSVGQVLDVLLDNALHHGAGEVGLLVRRAPGGVVFEVSDQGEGLPDESQLFRRGAGSGRGIGLALARTITEAEGGRLVAVSQQPPRFELTLPGIR